MLACQSWLRFSAWNEFNQSISLGLNVDSAKAVFFLQLASRTNCIFTIWPTLPDSMILPPAPILKCNEEGMVLRGDGACILKLLYGCFNSVSFLSLSASICLSVCLSVSLCVSVCLFPCKSIITATSIVFQWRRVYLKVDHTCPPEFLFLFL